MTRKSPAPKIPCPMGGKIGAAWGGYDQCEHCGKMVFISDNSRYAKHDLPASMARAEQARRVSAATTAPRTWFGEEAE